MPQIEVRFPGGKKTETLINGFSVLSDQPESSGGEGAAPSPFDMFLVSIASCAGYYAMEFCKGRNIPVDDLSVSCTTEYDPERRLMKQININVMTPEGFPEKYKDAILKAVDQCAVKRHLVNPPDISVRAELR